MLEECCVFRLDLNHTGKYIVHTTLLGLDMEKQTKRYFIIKFSIFIFRMDSQFGFPFIYNNVNIGKGLTLFLKIQY